ncbi:MAG: MaoC family dehydratase [Gammaproteobacteria bacterium]|nr:MaoC family dehydratase [Gammaproteobacteria bacterium]
MTISLTKETLGDYVGEEIGVSPWVQVTQEDVNVFAQITRDPQFIHIDPVRAANTPFGGTIAHGFFTLSMLSYFLQEGAGVTVEGTSMAINYGFDKLRFLAPVRVGRKIRGRIKLLSAEESKPNQFRLKYEVMAEIEGEDKPALIAEWLTMAV